MPGSMWFVSFCFQQKQNGGIRYEKLQKYPKDLSYLWRRLNCLSAVELREFFKYDHPSVCPEEEA